INFFFFKQKTAYEIETDWSSDVCSSDLRVHLRARQAVPAADAPRPANRARRRADRGRTGGGATDHAGRSGAAGSAAGPGSAVPRSEERRVGKEGRLRWWRDHGKKDGRRR